MKKLCKYCNNCNLINNDYVCLNNNCEKEFLLQAKKLHNQFNNKIMVDTKENKNLR